MQHPSLPTALLLLALASCGSGGNVKTVADYDAPPAPPVEEPLFNPNAHTGETPATWAPPVFTRQGTLVRPRDPSVEFDREDYERAPWATGTNSPFSTVPGTF